MFDITTVITLLQNFGMGLTQTGIILWLLWKIANNHLAHIAIDIKECLKGIDEVKGEIKDIKGQCVIERERVAKLEGKLE